MTPGRRRAGAASPTRTLLDGHPEKGQTHRVLFMVIERFKNGDAEPVGERFARSGRMLPDGVVYEASWLDQDGARCFQLMHAPDVEALEPWIARWSDLIEFEVVPVMPSSDFWAQRRARRGPSSD